MTRMSGQEREYSTRPPANAPALKGRLCVCAEEKSVVDAAQQEHPHYIHTETAKTDGRTEKAKANFVWIL